MSEYTSENTKVLATCECAGNNTRMLLLHEFGSGRLEYVVGSYFTQEEKDAPKSRAAVMLRNEAKSFAPAMRGYGTGDLLNNLAQWVENERPTTVVHYSWDWGHYFGDVVSAVEYWKREVLGEIGEEER